MTGYAPNDLMSQGKTVITAHSGCEGTPDNSIEHIEAAIASGAEMIEVDVRQATDGSLYLSHDVPENIDMRPLLKDLFEQVAKTENMGMNLDVKTKGLIVPVMELARKYKLSKRIVFTGACNSDRALANSLGAEMWRSAWPGDSITEGIKAIMADGSPYLNVHFGMITAEDDRALKEAGRGFSAWTVNDEAGIRRFLEMGISNITTRMPVLALKLRKEIQGV